MIEKAKILLEKSKNDKTRKFMRQLLAFYKKYGKLSAKQMQAIDKTWRNEKLT